MALISLNLTNIPTVRKKEKRFNPLEVPGMINNIGAVFGWVFGGQQSASGELIDSDTALCIESVYTCIRIISNTIGSLPLKLYEIKPKGREEAVENDLYNLLSVSPNSEMGAVVFWQTVITGMALTGNAYVYIQRLGTQVDALWPLDPRMVKPKRIDDGTPTGKLVYESREGLKAGQLRTFAADEILHFRLFSLGGMVGLSPVELHREGLGIARAATKTAGRVFANSSTPGGIMMAKSGLDDKDIINARESWNANQTGSNFAKTAFLNGGEWEYIPMTLNLEQLEFLKSRAYQRTEIAAIWGVDPHFLGDTTRLSSSSAEQLAINLVTFTLRPYISQIENEIQRKLLPTQGRKANKYAVQFDVGDLIRGDFKTQMDGFALARNGGYMNADEIRGKLGMNPITDGTGAVYIVAVNYRNAKDLLVEPEPQNEELLKPPVDTTPALLSAPAPAQNDPNQPSDNERSLVRQSPNLLPLYKDAIGRLLHRDKHDLRSVEAVFGPTLRHILSLAKADAFGKIGIEWNDETAEARIIADVEKGIEKRSATWTAENVDDLLQDEFRKAIRAILANVYRETAAASVE